jgi:prepilin-type N-terminal cleavage/methylation domain-containing protein
MLNGRAVRGFTLIEALVALALMLAGLAGGSVLLLQCVQYERESSHRRAALRLAASLADELRALDRGDGQPLPADSAPVANWAAAVRSLLPAGSAARLELLGASPARYRIVIEWQAAGAGLQRLSLPVTS